MWPFGWIYFIGAPAVNRVKIGVTEGHPSQRLAAIRGLCPVDLIGIGLIRGTIHQESLIHSRLRVACWKNEWFNGCELLFDFIRDNMVPWNEADKISYPYKLPIFEWGPAQTKAGERITAWFEEREIRRGCIAAGRIRRLTDSGLPDC